MKTKQSFPRKDLAGELWLIRFIIWMIRLSDRITIKKEIIKRSSPMYWLCFISLQILYFVLTRIMLRYYLMKHDLGSSDRLFKLQVSLHQTSQATTVLRKRWFQPNSLLLLLKKWRKRNTSRLPITFQSTTRDWLEFFQVVTSSIQLSQPTDQRLFSA